MKKSKIGWDSVELREDKIQGVTGGEHRDNYDMKKFLELLKRLAIGNKDKWHELPLVFDLMDGIE